MKLTKAEATSDPASRTRLKVDVKRVPKDDHLEVEVTGTIRPADGSFDRRYRVDDPAKFAAKVLQHALAERASHVKKLGTGTVPPTAKLLAAHD